VSLAQRGNKLAANC